MRRLLQQICAMRLHLRFAYQTQLQVQVPLSLLKTQLPCEQQTPQHSALSLHQAAL